MRSPHQSIILASLLLAGFAAGYTVSAQRSTHHKNIVAAEVAKAPAERQISASKGLSDENPRRQLQWLADHAGDSFDFEAELNALFAKGLAKNERAFHELLTLWASRDPLAAFEYTKQLKGMALYHSMGALITGWVEHDYKGLAAWLQESDGKGNELLRTQAVMTIARRDPNLAFATLTHGKPSDRSEYFQLFSTLGKSDPRAAILLLDKLPKESKQNATWAMVSSWSKTDPVAALSWVRELDDPETRSQALPAVIGSLSQSSPQEAARLVSEELAANDGSPQLVPNLLLNLFSSWNITDRGAAKEWIATLPEKHRPNAMHYYKQSLAFNHPEEFLLEVKQGKNIFENEQHLLTQALGRLSQTSSSNSAFEWLNENREWLPKAMFPNIVSNLLHQEPTLAPQLLPMLSKGSLANVAYQQAGQKWAEADSAKAAAFMATLPPGAERDAFQQGMFQYTVAHDVKQAYTLLQEMPNGELKDSFLVTLASQSKEHLNTADWIMNHAGSEKGGANALANLIRTWAQAAPTDAATWLQKTPAGSTKDTLINTFSRAIVQRDPDSAIQWASSIQEEKVRLSAMEGIAREWLHSDRKAAQEWIKEAPFTDKVKARLLR